MNINRKGLVLNFSEASGRILAIEDEVSSMENQIENMQSYVRSEVKKKWVIPPQAETQYGLSTALCIDTLDPWKQNRVRFFSPLFHDPNTPVKALPWADAVSAMGGFDDCGLCWVPPAGSTLCLIFAGGHRSAAFYLGTTWHRNRGPDGQHNWGFNIDEYYQIHEGHRKGYLVGPNDGSQVYCQWNTEMYNGNDITSLVDFENDPEARKKLTYPNIYGAKTPQKHMWKNVDGDYKCNHKHKRMEWLSSCGNYMVFKDDHIHGPTWVNPYCQPGGDISNCMDDNGKPLENLDCDGQKSNSSILYGHPSTPKDTTYGLDSNTGSNPYFKHQNECRPVMGPGTPQNNKLQLPQSGIQFLTISGHSFYMDDSVEEPRGIPEWERSLQPFDYGCSNKYLGKTGWISSTGHVIEMSDVESDSQLRGDQNYIRLLSACGNRIELNDHTVGQKDCPGCPPNVAGSLRGITLQSTSNHIIEMIDEENQQCSPCRMAGDQTGDGDAGQVANAKKGRIRVRTGYGLEILMADYNSQQHTDGQYIQITSPQIDNTERGPHILRFQEKKTNQGQVWLRVGGDYYCMTYDNHITEVGDPNNESPCNKMTYVKDNTLIYSGQDYFNIAKQHTLLADETIFLMAGKDCPTPSGQLEPCVYPVLVYTEKGVAISDRVFASASKSAACVDITSLTPFHQC